MNKTHLVVTETVSFQGQFPDTRDTRFYIDLTDDQPYVRYSILEADKGVVDIDLGWVTGPAVLLVRCEEKRDETAVVTEPTPDRMTTQEWDSLVVRAKERTAHMIQLAEEAKHNALVISVDGVDFTEVPIGQSSRILTIVGKSYSMRMKSGKAKVSVHVYPRDMRFKGIK